MQMHRHVTTKFFGEAFKRLKKNIRKSSHLQYFAMTNGSGSPRADRCRDLVPTWSESSLQLVALTLSEFDEVSENLSSRATCFDIVTSARTCAARSQSRFQIPWRASELEEKGQKMSTKTSGHNYHFRSQLSLPVCSLITMPRGEKSVTTWLEIKRHVAKK